MISLKVLSTAAVMALVVPIMMPSASFADPPHRGAPGGARPAGRPGGGVFHSGGGGPGPRFGGGGGYHRSGGNIGAGVAAGIAGAVIGGAVASQGYYGGPGYYAPGPGYYDDQYYDDGTGAVAVAPAPSGDDAVAYCMQTYRSYDPQSGTYLGNDGYRHPCP
jgi:hypothetical protein